MKVSLLQTDIVWANPQKNQENAHRLLDEHAGADLYVLPEMFSTGFATEPQGIAEADESSLQWMKTEAQQRHCAICGSVATEVDGKFYNRFYFVFPDGSERHYDKHHLFTYSGEHHRFTPGEERVVVEYGGMRILLQVCYDLRFPVFSRNRSDYDMAIYVASWPTVRLQAWTALLHARAIENQCYIIGVDRTGDDPACSYSGGSEIIDPYGQTIVACERDKVDVVAAELSMEPLEAFRQKFPVLNDADKFKVE
ncbi:MAG: amidohydrolase [Prevotella sp.]|nr:amidohydrolase [Prevotella sp.]